jgi:hypothetical protein
VKILGVSVKTITAGQPIPIPSSLSFELSASQIPCLPHKAIDSEMFSDYNKVI